MIAYTLLDHNLHTENSEKAEENLQGSYFFTTFAAV